MAAADINAAVVFEKVSKSFGDHCVLKDVSLLIPRGAIMVMLGPSGTGKSVLLRCLVGLIKPDSGRILVFNEDLTRLDDQRAADRQQLFALRRRFGMLFQDGALFDDMSVGDNVAFPMRQHTSWREPEIKARVAENLERDHTARHGNRSAQMTVRGVTRGDMDAEGLQLAEGRWLNALDADQRRHRLVPRRQPPHPEPDPPPGDHVLEFGGTTCRANGTVQFTTSAVYELHVAEPGEEHGHGNGHDHD